MLDEINLGSQAQLVNTFINDYCEMFTGHREKSSGCNKSCNYENDLHLINQRGNMARIMKVLHSGPALG